MANYIDAFLFPISKEHLDTYRAVSEEVAEIWKEYGAINYNEFLGDELQLQGTKSFSETLTIKDSETVIFGWATFPSKEIRDDANQKVRKDSRMHQLVAPLMNPEHLIFDASKMLFGGFKAFVES